LAQARVTIIARLLDAILVDVTPHTLASPAEVRFGRIVPDQYGPIIHRNDDSAHAKQFQDHPDQTYRGRVYQGEETAASRNTLLGKFCSVDWNRNPAARPASGD
jgi:hypothetical protein